MDKMVVEALNQNTLIDITTVGRNTGQPRRIEIWFHYQDGRILITGSPGPRGWYANVVARPEFTWHFKQSLIRDIQAVAAPITDTADRRVVLDRMRRCEERMSNMDLDVWTKTSPLVEVTFLS